MRRRSQRKSRGGAPLLFAALILGTATGLGVSAPGPARGQDVPQEVEDLSDRLDVPYVASHQNVVDTMLSLAKVTKDDYVIDLGSGDGRINITAAKKYGARGFGVDLNAELVAIANRWARADGIGDRARFYVRDLFKTDISQATVLTMYLLPDIVLKLRPRLLADLRPGTRILSHDYDMGDWRPDISRRVLNGWGSRSVVHFWVVPADVAGVWRWRLAAEGAGGRAIAMEATLRQRYQDPQGEIVVAGTAHALSGGRLRGDRIAFTLAPRTGPLRAAQHYTGTVAGDRIAGTVRIHYAAGEVVRPWQARRVTQGSQGRPR